MPGWTSYSASMDAPRSVHSRPYRIIALGHKTTMAASAFRKNLGIVTFGKFESLPRSKYCYKWIRCLLSAVQIWKIPGIFPRTYAPIGFNSLRRIRNNRLSLCQWIAAGLLWDSTEQNLKRLQRAFGIVERALPKGLWLAHMLSSKAGRSFLSGFDALIR